jgi:hypothetical protein
VLGCTYSRLNHKTLAGNRGLIVSSGLARELIEMWIGDPHGVRVVVANLLQRHRRQRPLQPVARRRSFRRLGAPVLERLPQRPGTPEHGHLLRALHRRWPQLHQERLVTTAPTNETCCGADLGNQYGDYQGIAAMDGSIHPTWTDRRSAVASLDEEIFTAAIMVK